MSNTKKSKIWREDLYKLLEVADTATESELKSAYRKKALKCHPDKNPDNPKAAELFMELSSALEILIDVKAREAYDKTRKAKQVNEARIKKLDSKRRKFKEDLERREKEAKESAEAAKSASFESNSQALDEELLKKEIDRLKKEGSRALREEQELIRQQIIKEQQDKMTLLHVHAIDNEGQKVRPKLKVKWSSSVMIDEAKLKNIFQKYGEVTNIIVIKRSALVEFVNGDVATKAFESESVKEEYQWKFEWVCKPSPTGSSSNSNYFTKPSPTIRASPQLPSSSFPTPPSGPTSETSFADFEAMILGKLSTAAKDQNNTS
ncbi:dnaJ homolog subfamily C member 17 [Folsomia candida]|uniref:dnaJ homolog subfamily C member 17 n=1 Tax=Folsomia candida TaxID=158441 RepID=UPI000B8F3FBD|nr:dnaJ homolog subfamily C member 17 [Folsomia candida]XP_035705016.1 dnaJ homolog subfamily C member 17 [Folsomia candida]